MTREKIVEQYFSKYKDQNISLEKTVTTLCDSFAQNEDYKFFPFNYRVLVQEMVEEWLSSHPIVTNPTTLECKVSLPALHIYLHVVAE